MSTTILGRMDHLLRDRAGVRASIERGIDLPATARAALLAIAGGSALFGAALGSFRGGVQVLYAAVKLPLVVLLTAAVCAPALTAMHRALDRHAELRRDLALVLSALALASLVMAAEAPILYLAVATGASYHQLILMGFGAGAVAGAVGLGFLVAGLAPGAGRGAVALGLVLVLALVGVQMAWMGRPYALRPRTPEVPFLRGVEGNAFQALEETWGSARGRYRRDAAPLPGEGAP
jgi:hypothetical protein